MLYRGRDLVVGGIIGQDFDTGNSYRSSAVGEKIEMSCDKITSLPPYKEFDHYYDIVHNNYAKGTRGNTIMQVRQKNNAFGPILAAKKFGLEVKFSEIRSEFNIACDMHNWGVGAEVYELIRDGIPGVQDEYFMIMEFFEYDLQTYLQSVATANIESVEDQINTRIEDMMEHNYLCVDIKPENILVNRKGKLVLTDFDANFCSTNWLNEDKNVLMRAFRVILHNMNSKIFKTATITATEVEKLKKRYANIDEYNKLRPTSTSSVSKASAIAACVRPNQPCKRKLDNTGKPILYDNADMNRMIGKMQSLYCQVNEVREEFGYGVCKKRE